ncbi:hypothetical protein Bxe_A1443 [Paraburkholderia xenovorans LB400]|uniref:Uncharacterized protein n=1 Tax=Paraburkholderia xenovorans (strain LB400) TaxID=266265 RepID=Q13WM8_PARXL|nr:hypothetical protein Bxe_A1443 [Paraburkholderia xenovorans LB400]
MGRAYLTDAWEMWAIVKSAAWQARSGRERESLKTHEWVASPRRLRNVRVRRSGAVSRRLTRLISQANPGFCTQVAGIGKMLG